MPTLPPPTMPTSDDVYAASKVKWRKLGVNEAADLDDAVIQSAAYLAVMTGRYFSDWPVPATIEGALSVNGTPEWIPLMRQAHRMRVEQIVSQQQPGYVATVTDDVIQSMSVGGYSETRRDPTRRGEEKTLNLWPGLNDLLWALMTPERYDYWIAYTSGAHAPAFSVEEVDWSMIGKDAFYGGSFNPYLPWSMAL